MSSSREVKIIFLAVLFFLSGHAFGLTMTVMPENLQTKLKEPQERTISLKLPLSQPDFHWTFMSKEDFLSGKLLLRITRNEKSEEIVIFENGRFTEGWEEMSQQQQPDRGEIYFGFISTKAYLTAPGDKLELELTVKKDLPGIGPTESGILPAGQYKSTGTYSGLIDKFDTSSLEEQLAKNGTLSDAQKQALEKIRSQYNKKAFLESWKKQWQLTITSQKGWLSDEQAAILKESLEKIEKLNEELKQAKANLERQKTNPPETKIENTIKISGTVYDEKGKPVSDAIVTIHNISQREEPRTDINGEFSINANMRYFRDNEIPILLIRHKERNLAAAVNLEDKAKNYEITMSPGVTLAGKVVDVNVVGIRNATLELIIWTLEHGRNKNETVEIDEKGNFQITALPAGYRYSVSAKADGYGQDYALIQTSQTRGDKYELEPITLKVANLSVSGIVVDNNEKPVANADIFMEGPGQQIHDTKTDINGKFTIDKICGGTVHIEADKFVKPQLSGHVRVEAGSTNVKIVISEVNSSGQPLQAHSLLNEPLPRVESLFPGFKPESIRDKKVLVCFWDYEQRPSRNCILQLTKQAEQLKEKNVEVIAIQSSKIELSPLDKWLRENNITFQVGVVSSNEEKISSAWGVKSLPWLILTDENHIVIAEGFGIAELGEKFGSN